MNQSEQMAFVRELLQTVGDKITQDIIDGKIPPEWDGHELRQLIADRFNGIRTTSLMSTQRKQQYLKDIVENNL